MNAAMAVTLEAEPLDFNDSTTRLSNRVDPNRDKTRYVACLGNHLENTDSRQLNSIGGWAGGLYVGHSEVGGAPTLRRTHHMILRGLFSPLETVAISRKADHKEVEAHRESYLDGAKVPPFTRGYTVYAGDDLAYLQSDRFRPMGVVEISSLMGVDWNSELRKTLQYFFFPEWQIWQRGQGEIPILLSDWEDLVKTAQSKSQYQNHELIAEELLESGRLFRNYALDQIERNRQAIQSMRATDHGGMTIGWHNKCRIFAEQLGIVLEDEKNIVAPANANTDGIVAEMREDRKLRQQELDEQKEYNRILLAKLTGETIEPVVTRAPEVVEEKEVPVLEPLISFGTTEVIEENTPEEETDQVDLSQIEVTKDLTYGCSEKNAQGEDCRSRVKEGETKCTYHKKQEELSS